jgi:hypothetical protein
METFDYPLQGVLLHTRNCTPDVKLKGKYMFTVGVEHSTQRSRNVYKAVAIPPFIEFHDRVNAELWSVFVN